MPMLEFNLYSSSDWLVDINQKLRRQTDINKNILQILSSICKTSKFDENVVNIVTEAASFNIGR